MKNSKVIKLLSDNAKLLKDASYLTKGLQMAPYNVSGYQVCKHASKGCAAACLFTAGRGRMTPVKEARINRTKLFFENREVFFKQLIKEIEALSRKGKKDGLAIAIRLNVISDLPWEMLKFEGQSIFERFPNIQFYDYTKSERRAIAFTSGKMPKNYHLTFSRSECNETSVDKVLASGGNVAAVFRGSLPKTYKGFKVIDGDKSDLRFLDDQNVIVGLVEKGLAKKDESGFVLEGENA